MALLREALLWGLPALAALVVPLTTGSIGPLPFIGGWFAASIVAVYLASRRLLELETVAAWPERLPDERVPAVPDPGSAGGVLAGRLMRPVPLVGES